MNIIKLITIAFLFISHLSYSIEKDRLITFLKEYEASEVKYNGKIAYAIEKGYPDVAEFFILKGDSIDQYVERYPLSFNPEDYKINSSLQNIYAKHPLLTAIRKGYKEIAFLMIQMGFGNKAEEYKVEYKKQFGIAQEEIERKNAMYIAIEESQDCYDVVLSLLVNGFDVDTSTNVSPVYRPYAKPGLEYLYQLNSVYTTPLLQAIAKKKLGIATLLLDYGADIEKVSQFPCLDKNTGYRYFLHTTPLSKAVEDNYIEGVLFLLSYGANPLKGSPNPLDKAIQQGYTDIIDELLNASLK